MNYQIQRIGQDILVEFESDGAEPMDLCLIRNFKRGVLMMEMLAAKQSGSLNYQLNGEVLSTQVRLKGEVHENSTF